MVCSAGGVAAVAAKCTAQLNEVVALVRAPQPPLARQTLGVVVVMDVHARDVAAELAAQRVADASAFAWQSQLRTYWEVRGAAETHCYAALAECMSQETRGACCNAACNTTAGRCELALGLSAALGLSVCVMHSQLSHFSGDQRLGRTHCRRAGLGYHAF